MQCWNFERLWTIVIITVLSLNTWISYFKFLGLELKVFVVRDTTMFVFFQFSFLKTVLNRRGYNEKRRVLDIRERLIIILTMRIGF